jgi:hypothetical protein
MTHETDEIEDSLFTESPLGIGARKPAPQNVMPLDRSTPGDVAQARAARKMKVVKELPPPKNPVTFYAQILRWSFGVTLLVIAGLIGLFYATEVDGDVPFYALAILAGALGAFLSSLTRLYADDEYPKLLKGGAVSSLRRGDLTVYSLVPPVVGMLAAAVLFVIFAAGTLEGGALFPVFKCQLAGAECATFHDFIFNFGPSEATGYARTIVWCFLAGFAERLVPDKLRGLVSGMAEGKAVAA